MFLRRSFATLAAISLALGAGAGLTHQAPTVRVESTRKAARRSLFGTQQPPLARWSYRGPGIAMAQQQRAAKKARNVRRHKQHVRGAR